MRSWCIWNTNALYQRVLPGGFIFLERITWVHIHYAFLVLFFPQRTNDLLTPNMPYNTCCLTSVFPNCVVQQLVVLFYWSGFFLHLMSFSSEYFQWYKTTCSQDAFLGNYGNSIYFKIGLGFFFHCLYDVLHEIRLGIAVAKNFWPELKIDSKFFFPFVTLYNELKSVD